MQKEIKGLVQAIFYASNYEEGLRLGKELIARLTEAITSGDFTGKKGLDPSFSS